MNLTVIILSLCQALLTTGNVLLVSVNALIGQSLAPDPWLVTLPVATQFIGLMLATIPASLIMGKIGRKNGFYLGNSIGICGAILCILALHQSWFALFCAGTLLLGVGIGFGTLYRFAAAEASSEEKRSRAISLVMAGGVIAAVAGPALAVGSRQWWPDTPFIGGFVGLLLLYILALILLTQVKMPVPTKVVKGDQVRPLKAILSQPDFIIAVSVGMVSYAVMNLLMTATPLAMQRCGFSFEQSTWVIQWHVLGMFVPSFFTGQLISRLGVKKMMTVGGVIMLLCIGINLIGQSEWHFWFALMLLGIGWNFMFISATQLVTTTYKVVEKSKAQAANEFLVFSTVTLSALFSGALEAKLGWFTMNLLMIPLVCWVIGIIVVLSRSPRRGLLKG